LISKFASKLNEKVGNSAHIVTENLLVEVFLFREIIYNQYPHVSHCIVPFFI